MYYELLLGLMLLGENEAIPGGFESNNVVRAVSQWSESIFCGEQIGNRHVNYDNVQYAVSQ